MSFSSVVVALSSPSSPLPARVAAKACLETLQEMVEGFRVCAAVLSEEEVLSPDFATQTRFLAAQVREFT